MLSRIDRKLPQDTQPGPAPASASAALQSMVLMFSKIGMQTFNATEVNLDSMTMQAAWSISDKGAFNDDPQEHSLNSAFLAATDIGGALEESPVEHTVVRKLSPRHWAYFWRLDDHRAIVAEVRYRDRRDVQSETDIALVRLICLEGMRAGQRNEASAVSTAPLFEWPSEDRRQPVRWTADTRRHGLCSVLLGVSALAALWLALIAVPGARNAASSLQAEAARLQAVTDNTMKRQLSAALATGDYGEVQLALTSFQALGYFQGAIVTNARQRVVSIAGQVSDASIGSGLPPSVTRAAPPIELTLGTERHGQLFVFGAPAQASHEIGFGGLTAAALLGALAALAAAAALLAPPGWLRRRRAALRR